MARSSKLFKKHIPPEASRGSESEPRDLIQPGGAPSVGTEAPREVGPTEPDLSPTPIEKRRAFDDLCLKLRVKIEEAETTYALGLLAVADHLVTMKAAYEDAFPETRHGGNRDQVGTCSNLPPTFIKHVAERIGRSTSWLYKVVGLADIPRVDRERLKSSRVTFRQLIYLAECVRADLDPDQHIPQPRIPALVRGMVLQRADTSNVDVVDPDGTSRWLKVEEIPPADPVPPMLLKYEQPGVDHLGWGESYKAMSMGQFVDACLRQERAPAKKHKKQDVSQHIVRVIIHLGRDPDAWDKVTVRGKEVQMQASDFLISRQDVLKALEATEEETISFRVGNVSLAVK
ncbi:MAG: hypothetical protein AMXMBFR56_53420 [Polyangiaceae bacterium]